MLAAGGSPLRRGVTVRAITPLSGARKFRRHKSSEYTAERGWRQPIPSLHQSSVLLTRTRCHTVTSPKLEDGGQVFASGHPYREGTRDLARPTPCSPSSSATVRAPAHYRCASASFPVKSRGMRMRALYVPLCMFGIYPCIIVQYSGRATLQDLPPLLSRKQPHKQPPRKQTSRPFAAYRQSTANGLLCHPSHLGAERDTRQASVGSATGIFGTRQALYACEGEPLFASLNGGACGRYAACPGLAQDGLQGDRSDTCPGLWLFRKTSRGSAKKRRRRPRQEDAVAFTEHESSSPKARLSEGLRMDGPPGRSREIS